MARKKRNWMWLALLFGGAAVGGVTYTLVRRRRQGQIGGYTPPALPASVPRPGTRRGGQSTEQVIVDGRNVGRAIQEDINRIYSRFGSPRRVGVDGIVGRDTRSAWNHLVRVNENCRGAPAVFVGRAGNSYNNGNPANLVEMSESTLYAVEMLIMEPEAQRRLAECEAAADPRI